MLEQHGERCEMSNTCGKYDPTDWFGREGYGSELEFGCLILTSHMTVLTDTLHSTGRM